MDGSPTIKTAETQARFTSGDWSLEVIPEGHQITAGPHVYVGLVQLASDDDARLMASARVLVEALEETRTDLNILRGNVADAARRDHRWEGMPDTVKGWIDRIDAALAHARGEPTPSPNDRSGA